jgi:hypothetical protein
MAQFPGWAAALNISPDTFREWCQNLPSPELALPWALENGKLDEQAYLAWASREYLLPLVRPDFYKKPPPLELWKKYFSGMWGPTALPLYEWSGTLVVGVLEPKPYTLPDVVVQLTLAPLSAQRAWWAEYAKMATVRTTMVAATPTATAATLVAPKPAARAAVAAPPVVVAPATAAPTKTFVPPPTATSSSAAASPAKPATTMGARTAVAAVAPTRTPTPASVPMPTLAATAATTPDPAPVPSGAEELATAQLPDVAEMQTRISALPPLDSSTGLIHIEAPKEEPPPEPQKPSLESLMVRAIPKAPPSPPSPVEPALKPLTATTKKPA